METRSKAKNVDNRQQVQQQGGDALPVVLPPNLRDKCEHAEVPTGTQDTGGTLEAHFDEAHRPSPCGTPAQSHCSKSHSSRSATTLASCRLTAAAELARRRLERERGLANLERQNERELADREHDRQRELARFEAEVDEMEMEAQLAASPDYRDKSVHSSRSSDTQKRTRSWIFAQSECKGNNVQCPRDVPLGPQPITLEAPLVEPTVISAQHRDTLARPAAHTTACTHVPTVTPVYPSNQFDQFAKAITALSERPKRPDLVIFSGEVSHWMAFKSSYVRTKHLFSADENMARLNNSVRGLAHQAVASLLWLSHDPEEVLRTLEQTFARPEILVAHEIASLRGIKISNVEHFNTLANKVRNCVATIKLLKQQEYLYSPELFRLVLFKLSEHTRSRFTDYAATHMPTLQNVSKLEVLSQFLLLEADRQLKYNFIFDVTSLPVATPKLNIFKPIKEIVHVTTPTPTSSSGRATPCSYCKQGSHTIKTCKAFSVLSVDDKWQWVRKAKVCYRCLKTNPHKWNDCRAKPCGTSGCTRRHHALLHGNLTQPIMQDAPNIQGATNIQGESSLQGASLCHTTDQLNVVTSSVTSKECIDNTTDTVILTGSTSSSSRLRGLLKVLPIVVEGPDGTFETTALLDEGSTATLIDSDVAARIGARPTSPEKLRIEGVSGMSKTVDVSYVSFFVRGRNLSDSFLIEQARAIKPLSLHMQDTSEIHFSNFEHLTDLQDKLTYEHCNPTVLIGAADWHLSLSRELRVGKKNQPVASRTLLGWVLHGAVSNSSKPVTFINHLSTELSCKPNTLETLIREQYEIDSLGISKIPMRHNYADQRAVDIIDSTAHRLDKGLFEVSLPWKDNLPDCIPDSYPQAFSRFKALERQMSKDEAFAKAYEAFMVDIIKKGYAEECDPKSYHKKLPPNVSCVNSDGSVRWYLPTFGVFHPQKKKIRVVHDAAAVTKDVCLNSLLLQGPDLLNSLLDILFRFREGPYALNADIKEMFPQIKIRLQDRDAQRFLWRDNGVLKEFRMSSMIFGAVSSPFIALHLMNKNAKEHITQFPLACQAILKDHYMDDYLGSHFTLQEAQQIASDIVTVHKACCFEMRAWVSNSYKTLALIPTELRCEPGLEVDLIPNKEIGVLGVKWNPSEDFLSFRVATRIPSEELTKRTLLSCVMKVYDPLGLITPVIIQGRILLQRLWREGIDWDTPIPASYVTECEAWFRELDSVINLKIPRWHSGKSDPCDIQLHILADGGEQAFACVAYWRFTYKDGSVVLSLIGGKARVAPLKPISIPRLELQAALIATRFAQTILNAHRLKPSVIIYWSDSTTVLRWIRSDARKFGAFEAHRLGEILEATKPSDWRWVPTGLNVADDATKVKNLNFSLSHRWLQGPSFLLEPENCWPVESVIDDTEPSPVSRCEVELVRAHVDVPLSYICVPNAARFSKWLRLVRATARVIQCARIFRSKISRQVTLNSKLYVSDTTTSLSDITARDIKTAEQMLFQQSQRDSFPEELTRLKLLEPVPSKSRIAALAPILDENYIIRMDIRTKAAPQEDERVIYPIILDGRHHITRLLIFYHHVNAAHGFNELVLNELRREFWILRARNTIRSVAQACLICRRNKAKLTKPRIGDLPPERLDHHKRPFSHVGVDYFGPQEVTVHRRHEKRWVALYTCLVSRAVHLEVVTSLSTDAALLSLRRFIARRGSPTTIFSDNGTNFVGANRELRVLFEEPIHEFVTNHKIIWKFLPPSSPFMGGAWERLVRSVKMALRACLKEKAPKEEIFLTLLLEAEAIVNSRPLTYISSSPETLQAITPFHFILGTSSGATWTSSLTDADLIRRCDWRRTLRLADHFWARWLREYLPTLRARGPNSDVRNLCEGDVVVIADSTLPRGVWPLGRVTKVFRGVDGVVRVVDVKTKGGILRRPVRKLLRIADQSQSVATSS